MDVVETFSKWSPFSNATWFTLGTLIFFVWLLAKASQNPLSPVKWEHLIIDEANNRASPYKVGYLIGVIVSTWVIVRWADATTLTYDIFGMYLTYLLGGAGFHSWSNRQQDKRPDRDRNDSHYLDFKSYDDTNNIPKQ